MFKSNKVLIVVLVLALICDLSIFGGLIYQNQKMKTDIQELKNEVTMLETKFEGLIDGE